MISFTRHQQNNQMCLCMVSVQWMKVAFKHFDIGQVRVVEVKRHFHAIACYIETTRFYSGDWAVPVALKTSDVYWGGKPRQLSLGYDKRLTTLTTHGPILQERTKWNR